MTTAFVARLIGLWIVLAVAGMLFDRPGALAVIDHLFADAALLWVTGVFTLLVGIAIVLTHNRWSGGPLAVLVTICGWLTLVKGVTFVWLPAPAQRAWFSALHVDQYYYMYLAFALLVGVYLTYAGFRQRS